MGYAEAGEHSGVDGGILHNILSILNIANRNVFPVCKTLRFRTGIFKRPACWPFKYAKWLLPEFLRKFYESFKILHSVLRLIASRLAARVWLLFSNRRT